MSDKIKILVLSRTAWRKDNSFGNTYSNLFGHMENAEVANIYLGRGIPDADNSNVVAYYRISEKEIANRLLHFNIGKPVGEAVGPRQMEAETEDGAYNTAFSSARKKRWSIFFMLREIIWMFGKVDHTELRKFVDEFKPDIIFLSFYYAAYVDRIALYIKKHYDVPMVLEAAIDIYSMKQFSCDPLFWINRLYIRSMIRKTVRQSEKLYVISEKMKRDYSKMLGLPCSVLYKSPDKERKLTDYTSDKAGDSVRVFLFTGNVSSGRWKSLGKLGEAIKEYGVGKLVIYTPTPMTSKMEKALRCCEVHEPVSARKVIELQNEADVLVHAESFALKDRLEVRYSISTKIMDYISAQRCILAIGPSDLASMEFLHDNDLAVCVNNPDDLAVLKRFRDPDYLGERIRRVREYVAKADSVDESCRKLEKDLRVITEKYKSSNL